jgi:hypothetical protein
MDYGICIFCMDYKDWIGNDSEKDEGFLFYLENGRYG